MKLAYKTAGEAVLRYYSWTRVLANIFCSKILFTRTHFLFFFPHQNAIQSLPPFSLSFTSNLSIYHTVTLSYSCFMTGTNRTSCRDLLLKHLHTHRKASERVCFPCMCAFKPSDRFVELKMPAVPAEQLICISENLKDMERLNIVIRLILLLVSEFYIRYTLINKKNQR